MVRAWLAIWKMVIVPASFCKLNLAGAPAYPARDRNVLYMAPTTKSLKRFNHSFDISQRLSVLQKSYAYSTKVMGLRQKNRIP